MERPPSPNVLLDIFLEKARLYGIDTTIAESLFETAAILYKPERRELPPDVKALAGSIDHTYLTVTPDNRFTDVGNVVRLCHEAGQWGMASVCIRPTKVTIAKHLLHQWGIDDIAVCTVIDFPHAKGDLGGVSSPEEKAKEAIIAQRHGATEFDVVMDYEAILRGDTNRAYDGIATVAHAVRNADSRAIVKAILETAHLRECGGEPAIIDAAEAAIASGADYLKTSTGYAEEGGATPEDILLLTEYAHPHGVLVKASGGIKDYATAKLLRDCGADRLGMSTSVKILGEALKNFEQKDSK